MQEERRLRFPRLNPKALEPTYRPNNHHHRQRDN